MRSDRGGRVIGTRRKKVSEKKKKGDRERMINIRLTLDNKW